MSAILCILSVTAVAQCCCSAGSAGGENSLSGHGGKCGAWGATCPLPHVFAIVALEVEVEDGVEDGVEVGVGLDAVVEKVVSQTNSSTASIRFSLFRGGGGGRSTEAATAGAGGGAWLAVNMEMLSEPPPQPPAPTTATVVPAKMQMPLSPLTVLLSACSMLPPEFWRSARDSGTPLPSRGKGMLSNWNTGTLSSAGTQVKWVGGGVLELADSGTQMPECLVEI